MIPMDENGIPTFDLSSSSTTSPLFGERHIIQAEEELRLELNFPSIVSSAIGTSSTTKSKPYIQMTLQKGSCELQGIELALQKTYTIYGTDGDNSSGISSMGNHIGMKLAYFTWHGAILDIITNYSSIIEMSYVSDETSCNIAYVNTHAQLEVLRDDSFIQTTTTTNNATTTNTSGTTATTTMDTDNMNSYGPRVLICGQKECGKSSLVRILTAYACKVGRTPIVIDLDPNDNQVSIPGTFSACVYDINTLSIDMYCQNCMTPSPPGSSPPPGSTTTNTSTTTGTNNPSPYYYHQPLVLWHGDINIQDDLYKSQIQSLANKVHKKMSMDDWMKSSGFIINTSSTILPDGQSGGGGTTGGSSSTGGGGSSGGVPSTSSSSSSSSLTSTSLLLQTIKAFQVNVVLVIGHDRLYSMLKSALTTSSTETSNTVKVIKVPRSGGVVHRDNQYLRQLRSRSIKRYFYGNSISTTITSASSNTTNNPTGTESNNSNMMTQSSSSSGNSSSTNAPTDKNNNNRIPSSLTPFLIQISYTKLQFYKIVTMNLSSSLLPVAQMQTTESIQLQLIDHTSSNDLIEQLLKENTIVAVCHPNAVSLYEKTNQYHDLYNHGIAGIVTIERILPDTEMIHLLAPCTGILPSTTLLVGDNLTWLE